MEEYEVNIKFGNSSQGSSGVVAYGSQQEMTHRADVAKRWGDKVEFIGLSNRAVKPIRIDTSYRGRK